jgi:hypothetical protein
VLYRVILNYLNIFVKEQKKLTNQKHKIMKNLLTFFIFLSFLVSNAQNLVVNPSFETHDTCPDYLGQVSRATDWYSIRMTPDYYNVCAPNLSSKVPENWFGNAKPASGNAYIGIGSSWAGNSYVFPECVGSKLLAPLAIGKKYFVSFKVFLSQKGNPYQWCGVNKLGALFSTVLYTEKKPAPICNCSQVYTNKIIVDTSNWVRISGFFIADSNYIYIGVGRFFDYPSTNSIQIAGTQCNAYYFLDDVCVSTDSVYANNYSWPGNKGANEEKDILIYPNPFLNQLTVKLKNYNYSEIVLYDILSRQFIKQTFYDSIELNTEHLSSGVYVYSIRDPNGIIKNGKLIKE